MPRKTDANHAVIGIDPGASGGIALIDQDGCSAAVMPDTPHGLAFVLASERITVAYIENVHSMPKQGVSSSFKFGKQFGECLGVLAALKIPYTLVSPSKWQRAMGCLSKGDKNVTKARAQQLFPSLKITHAIADALLIAEYGRRAELGLLTPSAKDAR